MVMFPYIQFVKRHRRQLNTQKNREWRKMCVFIQRATVTTGAFEPHSTKLFSFMLYTMRFLLINANSNSKTSQMKRNVKDPLYKQQITILTWMLKCTIPFSLEAQTRNLLSFPRHFRVRCWCTCCGECFAGGSWKEPVKIVQKETKNVKKRGIQKISKTAILKTKVNRLKLSNMDWDSNSRAYKIEERRRKKDETGFLSCGITRTVDVWVVYWCCVFIDHHGF